MRQVTGTKPGQDHVRPVMEEYPHAWLFFVPFILVTSFAILNLFIGIIVDAMQVQHIEEDGDLHEENKQLEASIASVRTDIAELRQLIEAGSIREQS
jgi:voltage-gated sodium channel